MKYILILFFSFPLLTFSQGRWKKHEGIHKYKVSTNILRPILNIKGFPSYSGWALSFSYISSGRVFSIEPEFQVSNQFSVAVPIYFGVNRMNLNTYDGTLYTSWNYIDSVTTPTLTYIQTNYQRPLDMIGQIGAQGKWFPWGHEIRDKSKFYPFLSVGIHTALYDIYAMDFGQTWTQENIDYIGPGGYGSGGQNAPSIAVRSHKTMVFRGEFLIGVELLFGKSFGFTYSMGYSTRRFYSNEATDRLYSRRAGEEYELIAEPKFPGEDNLYVDKRKIPIHRLQLTYAFGRK
jgi:hypothetical protein